MKNLIQSIQEKLVITKDTKEKKHIKVDVEKSSFTEKEIGKIIKYCYELPVLPDEITNLKNKEDGRLITKIKINFYKQDNSNVIKRIVLNKEKISSTSEYEYCVILRSKINSTNYILPEDHQTDKGEYYKNIKECINGLKTFNMMDDFLNNENI